MEKQEWHNKIIKYLESEMSQMEKNLIAFLKERNESVAEYACERIKILTYLHALVITQIGEQDG